MKTKTDNQQATYQYFDVLDKYPSDDDSLVFDLVCTDDHMPAKDLDTYLKHMRSKYNMTKRTDRVSNITFYYQLHANRPLFAIRKLH